MPPPDKEYVLRLTRQEAQAVKRGLMLLRKSTDEGLYNLAASKEIATTMYNVLLTSNWPSY